MPEVMPNESGSRLDLSPSSCCSSIGSRLHLSSPLCALVLDWTENGFVAIIRGSQLWWLYNFSHQGCTRPGEKKGLFPLLNSRSVKNGVSEVTILLVSLHIQNYSHDFMIKKVPKTLK